MNQDDTDAWRNAAIRIGENLATCGPDGYYEFDANQWLAWAMMVTTKMQEDYVQLGACGEREACAYRASIAMLGADRELANRVDKAIRAGENK